MHVRMHMDEHYPNPNPRVILYASLAPPLPLMN